MGSACARTTAGLASAATPAANAARRPMRMVVM